MTDYVKSTNFTSKDSLATGNPLKIVKGAEFDTEFNAIATAIATKADLASPALSGVPTAPTAATGTNTTQVSTTAFVKNAVDAYDSALTVSTSQIEDSAVTTAKIADDNVTTDKLADASVTIPKIDATGTASATTFLRGDGAWIAPATDVQTFNSTGTWTKPTGGQTMARIQVWGGGGGGGRCAGAAGSGGGGGGGYSELTLPLSYLADTVTATVGTGGAGATVNNTSGANGGSSNFPIATTYLGFTQVFAGAGAGGRGDGSFGGPYGGGGGGGPTGSAPTAGNPTPGTPLTISGYFDAAPLYQGSGAAQTNGTYYNYYGIGAQYHGGGGGFTITTGASSGGSSLYGGGGGAGGASGATLIAGGASVYGGAGGSASNTVANAGVQPGGGGGAAYNGGITGGSGAAGRIIVTCW